MSAEVLREAAATIRAEWEPKRGSAWSTVQNFHLAVADWLEVSADSWVIDPGCDLGGGYDFYPPCGACFKCAHYKAQTRALAVATAYLGADR